MLWQLIVNGIVAGAAFALIAIGFALIYNTAGFFHFAHGALFTVGAYSSFFLVSWLGVPLIFSIPIAIATAALIGCFLDLLFFVPLRRRGSSPLVLLLASLGIYIVLQNLVSMFFGDDIKTIRSGAVEEGIAFFGARITTIQICIVSASIAVLIAVIVFFKASKIGKAMRAISNDPELARVSGIDSERVILLTFALGSALAGLAGILVALDVDMTPTMGMNALMMGVVAVVIGGTGSIAGVAFGALFLGIAQHLGVWKISSLWQDAIAFAILLVFLLIKPEGFMGKKIRKVTT